MKWNEFIQKILDDFRYSTYDVERLTGIPHPVIHKIRTGITKRPTQFTIKRLEQGLGIKVNNSNPANITYEKVGEKQEFQVVNAEIHAYPVVTHVYAGNSPALFQEDNIKEYVQLPYGKTENCFAVKVIGDSMHHVIDEGDFLLVDMDKEISNGCIVVALLKDGKQIIKRYRAITPGEVMFYSDNGNYEPLVLPNGEIEAIYKVVGIWKKL